MARQVELEVVNYKLDEVEHTTKQMVMLFAKHSGIKGTDRWMNALLNIHDYFQNGKTHEWTLGARGLELAFSGFPEPSPRIVDGEIVLKTKEPSFVLDPYYMELTPREKTIVEKATEAIAMEMGEAYHLQVSTRPTTLVLPHKKYA